MDARNASLGDYQRRLLERIRCKDASNASSSHLAFEVGEEHWVVPLTEVTEVVPVPKLARVPLAADWLVGMANIRGNLYAVTDFAAFLGGTPTASTPQTRLILLHTRYHSHAALLVRRSLGLCQLPNAERHDGQGISWRRGIAGGGVEGIAFELCVSGLARDRRFLQAAA
jgi:twitching motility protein PilI